MLVYIRGAGDIATGVAVRLHKAGCDVVMGEVACPTSIRRTVCFSEAIRLGATSVEGVVAQRSENDVDVATVVRRGNVAVVVDPEARLGRSLHPDVVVDAILAKYNTGTCMDWASIVIAIGPGFSASIDCHAVIESKRGHYLGQVIYRGSAQENTGIPGLVAGFGAQRVLRAPTDGVFESVLCIGAKVEVGDVVAYVHGVALTCPIKGVLRGLLADGIEVVGQMKCGDIDPRNDVRYCFSVSDKARAIGGGVLEALLHYSGGLRRKAIISAATLTAISAGVSAPIEMPTGI